MNDNIVHPSYLHSEVLFHQHGVVQNPLNSLMQSYLLLEHI